MSETKLNTTQNIEIDAFKTPIQKERNLNNGGGLAIYTENSIYSVRRQDLENNNIENIWIEVNTFKNKVLDWIILQTTQ